MTVEELLSEYPSVGRIEKSISVTIKDAMIEFAKFHVDAALKKACDEAKVSVRKLGVAESYSFTRPYASSHDLDGACSVKVNKDSILESYPLTNIK